MKRKIPKIDVEVVEFDWGFRVFLIVLFLIALFFD